jgi:hypothetical protein
MIAAVGDFTDGDETNVLIAIWQVQFLLSVLTFSPRIINTFFAMKSGMMLRGSCMSLSSMQI